MFKWYQNSSLCVVYLKDVDGSEPVSCLPQSKWFNRGFTLQELIAPNKLDFVDKDWNCFYVLSKQRQPSHAPNVDPALQVIARASRVSLNRLTQSWSQQALNRPGISEIMFWASDRDTTRPEDKAYSLMGLFGINMTVQYGEGDHAFSRLQRKLLKRHVDDSIFDWDEETTCNLAEQTCFYTQGMLASSAKAFAKRGTLHQRSRELDIESPIISIMGQEISLHGHAYALEVPSVHRSAEFFVLPLIKSDNDLLIMKLRDSWTQYRVSGRTFHDYTCVEPDKCVRTARSMQHFRIALRGTVLPTPT
ncbi:hypothetical protein AMS68_004339 [Peltaster fructicola]|uniref:Heterokaryon incompatibility domain-containing protein n=1 Tax=Peltaster fructicola TaxID=286661 RepID=A0A6H0XVM9_9PEZI|nr:hypothetical protein AMS68_004339 [Peltaster fructicola]